jgi:hypothetical protein
MALMSGALGVLLVLPELLPPPHESDSRQLEDKIRIANEMSHVCLRRVAPRLVVPATQTSALSQRGKSKEFVLTRYFMLPLFVKI